MPERRIVPDVYGVETEYSCLLTFPGDVIYEIVGKCHSVDDRLGLYQEPTSKGSAHIEDPSMAAAFEDMGLYKTSAGMLSNGGRFYIDPSGPEYDTPETATAEEAVYRTFDGDDILLGVFNRLRERGILQGFQVNRRIVDHNRSSRGIHLNTTTSLPANREPSQHVMEALSTLNVVKGAVFGSGGLLLSEDGETQFHHSPRLSITTTKAASYYDYKGRPLVRQPFKSDGRKLARIETVTSDALNFGWPLRASLVVTNSLVRVLELGRNEEIPTLPFPVLAAWDVGRYGYEANVDIVKESEGFTVERSLNVLKYICELILSVDEKEGILNDEARQVIPEVIDVADRMDDDPFSVAAQVESIARLLAMRKKMDKSGVPMDSETMCRFDYAWDWVGGGGIAEILRRKNIAGWQGFKQKHSPHGRARRRNIPPADTRAKIRGELIRDSAGDVDVDWTGTKHNYFAPLDTIE